MKSIIWAVVLVFIARAILKYIRTFKEYFFNDFNYKKAFLGDRIKIFYNDDPLVKKISANVKSKNNCFVLNPYFKGFSEEESVIRVLYTTGEYAYYVYRINIYNDKIEFYQIYNFDYFNPDKMKFEFDIEREII